MKALIEGGWVVAFNGTSHEVYENGSVMYENDRIVHAGGPYTGTVDTRLSARGQLVSPGFINTHVHTTGNGGDYMLHDMVAELRWASMLAKITDQHYQVGQPRDVYNAATLGACTFLGRDDLGRLAPGAKADILLINLDHLGSAFYADPIKALVDFGCGRDVDTVIVDGKTLVQGGDVVHVDEAEVYANAQQATRRFWSQIPTWHWGGCNLEKIVPPAFPIHRTTAATS